MAGRGCGWLMQLLSLFFGGVALASISVAAFTAAPPYVVGENLVLMEMHLFPGFYLKPITLFTYSFFLMFAFGLYSPTTLRRARSLPPTALRFFYVTAWFTALASGFELVYHMVLWSAALSVQGLQNPDVIVNIWPQNEFPINVVFSSKLVVMIFIISLMVIDYLRRIEGSSNMFKSD
ncbi:MAG: hypothetical protein QW638_08220 [Candidatus Bathyarchaeia archaeon]|nr:hypothetical protein [Candidatus Bathyarchaeota archaeon]